MSLYTCRYACAWYLVKKKIKNNDDSLQMKYENLTVDVKIETQIKPAAFSAIFESHTSMVTAIQWVHPLNEVSRFTFCSIKTQFIKLV